MSIPFSTLIAQSRAADLSTMQSIVNNDQHYYLFTPWKTITKSIARYTLAFNPLIVCAVFDPAWIAFTIPLYAVVSYKYYIFTQHMKCFNLSPRKLWLTLVLLLILTALLTKAVAVGGAFLIDEIIRCRLHYR